MTATNISEAGLVAVILVMLPLALICVLWALAGESLSMFVLMGIVMMIGVVVNRFILISGILTLVIIPILYDLFTRKMKDTGTKMTSDKEDVQ